jgi:hypothetical protein
MWLTRLALRNPVLILMLSLMMIVLGWVSVQRLSVDLFPDITIPVIRVATFYNGAGPADDTWHDLDDTTRGVGLAGCRPRRARPNKASLSSASGSSFGQPRQRAVRVQQRGSPRS